MMCFALPLFTFSKKAKIFLKKDKLFDNSSKDRSSKHIKSATERALGPDTQWHVCSIGTKEPESDRKFGEISWEEKKDCAKKERAKEKEGMSGTCG